MRKLRIGIVDLVAKGPTNALFARYTNAALASIMTQAVAVWCAEAGHEAIHVCYTGFEDFDEELPRDCDFVFIAAFTEAAYMAYALSALFRSRGAVTALGGPHARCYPHDAAKYFDYVFGFTDKTVIGDALRDCSPHRPLGLQVAAAKQPETLPGVRERWPFLEPVLRKAGLLKAIPMVGSLGCPYKCSFCIDSTVPYQVLDLEEIQEDLRFLLTKVRKPLVAWYDPNFGVRFDAYMEAIEAAVPPGEAHFGAESSLSLLSEAHLKRLQRNGFRAMFPGIESWYGLNEKSRTSAVGAEKVRTVADHVNMILRYIPYVQCNLVFGLDGDEGSEPFELSKRFADLAPGAFPALNLLTSYGQAAPVNLEYQRSGRVIPLPFNVLNNRDGANMKPSNYGWREFYDLVLDLSRYVLSWKAIARRFRANREMLPRWMNFVRGATSFGRGWNSRNADLRRRFDTDRPLRRFFDQETTELPEFYREKAKQDLGPLWDWLPTGALMHDPNGWLNSLTERGRAAAGSTGPTSIAGTA